jgi:hypothetical protein
VWWCNGDGGHVVAAIGKWNSRVNLAYATMEAIIHSLKPRSSLGYEPSDMRLRCFGRSLAHGLTSAYVSPVATCPAAFPLQIGAQIRSLTWPSALLWARLVLGRW